MADTHYGDESVARKTFPTHRTKLPSAAEQAVHDEIVGHPLVSADDQIAVLALIDEEGGKTTLLDCIAALPNHPRQVSALVAMAAAGIVGFDRDAPFDANCRVARIQS